MDKKDRIRWAHNYLPYFQAIRDHIEQKLTEAPSGSVLARDLESDLDKADKVIMRLAQIILDMEDDNETKSSK